MSITRNVRRTCFFVAVAVLVAAVLPVLPSSARAAAAGRPLAPTGSGSADPAARIATLRALVAERTAAQTAAVVRRDTLARRLTEARLAENLALEQADLLRRAAVRARSEYRTARDRHGEIAASYYRRAGNTSPVAALTDVREFAKENYRRAIVERVEEQETRRMRQALLDRRAAVRAEREAVSTHAQWRATAQRLREELPRQEQAIRDLQGGISNARFWLARWESIGLGVQTPIMSNSVLGANEIARWFNGTRRRARITVPMADLARAYIEEGETAQVRGDIAFAQSILETGSFYFPDGGQLTPTDNNFAGMDACDSCARGRSFPDARTGVRAQLQQLRIYADPTATNASFNPPPVVANLDRHHLKGQVPTWDGLTHTWATADTYGDRIIAIYAQMLAWLTDRAEI